MNEFEPQSIKSAANYLNEKLESVMQERKPLVFIVEKKKKSLFARILASLFGS